MTVELAIILGFVFHLLGDYVTQNDWLANEKTKSFLPAFIHATCYSLPFLWVCGGLPWVIIYVSHFLIDRYRLAVYWIKLVNWNWGSKNFGYDDSKPSWMSVWLMIAVDNVIHIVINTFCIYFYYP